MAHYHLHVKPGPKGEGAEHAQYIERGGRFKAEKYGEIGEHERGNLPAWAKGSAASFFAAADEHERVNGNSYREFEIALPKELADAERGQLVREFVAEQIGDKHAYAWAIHEPRGHNPHVHMMFSERLRDGLERGPEQYFKRANSKNPERGGHLKSDRFTSRAGPQAVESLRARWAEMQNQALERAGVEARVDHRSLNAQGIEREAGQHRGPAVSGVEARGEVAEVSVRREAERVERARERAAVEAEVRVVTRQEMALERVAVRERRKLAQEATGEARAVVLPLVEADRREQLGRAQAAAERRVERRQGLSMGGQLKEKLLTQARALRERIGQQLGRIKAWVAERFPESLQQLKEHTRDLFGVVSEKARGAKGPTPGKVPSRKREAEPQEPESGRRAQDQDVERSVMSASGAAAPDSGRSLETAERARILKEAAALGRQELSRQVRAVRDEQATRQRLDELVRQERARQRAQQLELERQRELERVRKLEQEQALKRSKDRGLGR